MPGEYKKIFRLASKSGVDYSTSVLEKGGASGHNWHVEPDGGSVTKRPGFAPFAAMPAIDEAAYARMDDGSKITHPYEGVSGVGVHTLSDSARGQGLWYAAESGDGASAYREAQEPVFVASGRLWSLRTVPAFDVTSVGDVVSYSFWPDSTGQFVFRLFFNEVEEATYSVTSSSTIADVAAAVGGSLRTAYQQGALPAYCLKHTPNQVRVDVANDILSVPCRITYSVPLAMGPTTSYTYRAFAPGTYFGFDTPVQMAQYGEWMLLAGQYSSLQAYDGFRLRSCVGQSSASFTSQVAGTLTGTFGYITRQKFVSPSGVVSYGPTQTFSETLAAENVVVSVSNFSSPQDVYVLSDSKVLGSSPQTTISTTGVSDFSFDVNVAQYADNPMLEKGEKVFFGPSTIVSAQEFTVTSYDPDTGSTGASVLGTDVSIASTNERLEIYRTVDGGSVYYLVAEIPLSTGSTYTDITTDAALVANDVYIETAFTPLSLPNSAISVTAHQNRAVVAAVDHSTGSSGKQPPPATINTVYYTEPNTLEFAVENSFVLDLADGDSIAAVFSYDDVLYVASERSLWLVTGDLGSATSFTVSKVIGSPGVVSNCAISAIGDALFCLSRSGVFTLAGRTADFSVGAAVNPLIRSLSASVLAQARLCADSDAGRLYVILPNVALSARTTASSIGSATYSTAQQGIPRATEQPDGSIVLVYDIARGSWYEYRSKTPVGGGATVSDGDIIMFPKRSNCPITVLNDVYGYDAFAAFDMCFSTPWEDLDDTTTSKSFIRAQVLSTEETSQNFVLETTTETDWKAGRPVGEFNLSFMDGEGYAENPYATVPYGDPNVPDHVVPLTNHKAKSMRLVFRNDDPAEKPTISGWVLEVAANSRNAKET
jgi:hypothetical protein